MDHPAATTLVTLWFAATITLIVVVCSQSNELDAFQKQAIAYGYAEYNKDLMFEWRKP